MQLLDLLILALATLYIVVVITTKAGPFGVFRVLRERYPDTSGLWHCVWCLAPYVGGILLALYLLVPYGIYPAYILAIAGAALAIRTYTGINHG